MKLRLTSSSIDRGNTIRWLRISNAPVAAVNSRPNDLALRPMNAKPLTWGQNQGAKKEGELSLEGEVFETVC